MIYGGMAAFSFDKFPNPILILYPNPILIPVPGSYNFSSN